jgi:hypothetical protein
MPFRTLQAYGPPALGSATRNATRLAELAARTRKVRQGCNNRQVDRALWTFGRFLPAYPLFTIER